MNQAADWRLIVAIGGASGLAASPLWDGGGSWVKPLVAAVLLAVLFVREGRAGRPAMVLIGLAAALAGLLVGSTRLASIERGALERPPGPITVTGVTVEPPSGSRGTLRFALDTREGRVLVETQHAPALQPGDGVTVSGVLGPAPDWLRASLERQGIGMVLRARTIEPNGRQRDGPAGWIDRLRDRAHAALAQSVPEQAAALSRGFVLGDDTGIDQRTVEDFRRSGLAHLLAVSGQNVVLLALLAIPFLSLAGLGPRARLAAVGLLILVYVPLAGGGPSIQRAGVMGIAGLVAAAAMRAPSRVYALAMAALVTLLLNPLATGDIGWQLSFAAVAGIMLLAGPLRVRLQALTGEDGWRGALADGVAVTIAATLATAPLTVIHFERVPVATVVANLAAMPAVAPAMWMGMIAIAAGQISPLLAAPFNLAGSLFLGWITRVAEWLGRPGWAVVELDPGPVALTGATLLIALLCALLLRRWRPGRAVSPRNWLPPAVALVLAAVLLVSDVSGRRELADPAAGGARIEVLDVGQGDAILIRPAGVDPILIDGGPPGGDLAGALRSADVDRLAAVLLTHADLDHYGGLLDVFGMFPVDRFLFDQAPPELIALARSSGAALVRPIAGDRLKHGNTALEILWPPPGSGAAASVGGETNDRSVVAVLERGRFRMLLTGDAEAEAVPISPGPVDVLKVSHHGSLDAGLKRLLAETSPELAVIPVGENGYGHPVPETLADLAAAGVPTLRTDHDGTVSIVVARDGVEVETGR